VAITPNRGDATSVYGVARDLAAADFGALKDGSVKPVPGRFPAPKIHLNFTPETASACPLFAGRLIGNVRNGASPQWVQERLKAVGLRPISALVDVTNLISLDRGRPLHVFDADKLAGDMQARLAEDGEQIIALDGKTYVLDSAMCVIADQKVARGIAGVMGGEETACTESTTNVFIESAYFDPARIAQTGRKLGIVSDARYRFERGVDPEFVVPGLELATKLILEFCGGEPSDIVVAGQASDWRRTIAFSPAAVRRPPLMPAQRRTKMVRRAIASRGFNETINFSFIPRAHAVLFGGGDHARQIENPIAADLDALRPSILPSLLAAAQRNQARGFKDLML